MSSIELPPVTYGAWQVVGDIVVPQGGLVLPSLGDIQNLQNETRGFIPAPSPPLAEASIPMDADFYARGGRDRLKQRMIGAMGLTRAGGMAGLAAVQIARTRDEARRFVALKAPDHPDADEYGMVWLDNPICEPLDDRKYEDSEGCYSCDHVGGHGERFVAVEVTADNLSRPLQLIDDPFDRMMRAARAAQHEIGIKGQQDGHLDGFRWPDVLSRRIRAGEIDPRSMIWFHAEHFVTHYLPFAARRRSGELRPNDPDYYWPITFSPDQWDLRAAGKLLLPHEVSIVEH